MSEETRLIDAISHAGLRGRIRDFLSLNASASLRQELMTLLSTNVSEEELLDRFMTDLSFGTAGLRAEMGVGFNRMNVVTVQLATQGVGAYLSATASIVIVGFDHRHNSRVFAENAARVLKRMGHCPRLFPRPIPTPLVPAAVRHLKAAFGIMITASHNPRDDNGYKAYGANGAQILDTVAREIAREIDAHRGKLNDLRVQEASESPFFDETLLNDVFSWYKQQLSTWIARLLPAPSTPSTPFASVPFVYTPMHGVGADFVLDVFAAIFHDSRLIHCVPEQTRPDPDFPTVQFPNPEEGAASLQLAMATADRANIRLIFANDPDADRFCVAERDDGGAWRIFNGNEIAAILATFIVERHVAEGKKVERGAEGRTEGQQSTPAQSTPALLSTCVSSRFMEHLAARIGGRFESTLTGFKNLGNRALQLQEEENYEVLFAYEEAIGYQVGAWNFDKDGISALITFYAALLAKETPSAIPSANTDEMGTGQSSLSQLAAPMSLAMRLETAYRKTGVWPFQCNGYYFCRPATRINSLFRQMRDTLQRPLVKEDEAVIRQIVDGAPANMITIDFVLAGGDAVWLTLRSSGTEPKIKYYSELLVTLAERDAAIDTETKQRELNNFVERIVAMLLCPAANGLERKSDG